MLACWVKLGLLNWKVDAPPIELAGAGSPYIYNLIKIFNKNRTTALQLTNHKTLKGQKSIIGGVIVVEIAFS